MERTRPDARSPGGMRRLLWIAFALAVVAVATLVLLAWSRAQTLPITALAKGSPARTALMAQREREARARGRRFRIDRRWVPYARIAPLLRRAVLIAEDDAFFAHGGLDWSELQAAARENLKKRRVARGGSTITQQLARNLYLGDARTPARKLTELFVALRLERELSKRRIFELYLNSIEWGDGIFGIEAAAERHFGVPASRLNERQAVLLAAVIINPRKYSPVDPARRIRSRARMIAGRLRRRGVLDEAQYQIAIGAPAPLRPSLFEALFGPRPDSTSSVEAVATPDSSSTNVEPAPADSVSLLHRTVSPSP